MKSIEEMMKAAQEAAATVQAQMQEAQAKLDSVEVEGVSGGGLVRMYLREMGAVELLSREGEIAIAKRIEAGRDTMIFGLCESPITFTAIIEWSNALNEGAMQLREILDLDAMLTKDPAPESLSDDEDGDDNGEISEKTAGPSYKEEEDVEEESSDDEEDRSEEHTSELQSLMRNSYAVFCLKKT